MSDHDDLADEPLPMRRIAALWDWLPAFRAVAETENLRRAATFLALSPPALSRTLKLLEDAIGHPLFVREGRRLQLTVAGARLLQAVRRAMRSVDEVLAAPSVVVRVHAPGLFAPLVARVVAAAKTPVVLTSREHTIDTLAHDMLRGALDAALVVEPHDRYGDFPDLVAELVGELAMVIVGRASLASDAPTRAVSLGASDGWPSDLAREIALETDDLASAIEASRAGLALALPRALAPDGVARAAIGPIRVAALRRAPVGPAPDRVAHMLDALRAAFGVI